MATDLNQNKDFGTVFGTGHPWKYEQDGKYFGRDMMEVHKDGSPVTIKEKIAQKKKEREALERKRKEILERELSELQESEKNLQEETDQIYLSEAAKNIHLVSELDDMKTVGDMRAALDILQYPYNPNLGKKELFDILEKIFEAAK